MKFQDRKIKLWLSISTILLLSSSVTSTKVKNDFPSNHKEVNTTSITSRLKMEPRGDDEGLDLNPIDQNSKSSSLIFANQSKPDKPQILGSTSKVAIVYSERKPIESDKPYKPSKPLMEERTRRKPLESSKPNKNPNDDRNWHIVKVSSRDTYLDALDHSHISKDPREKVVRVDTRPKVTKLIRRDYQEGPVYRPNVDQFGNSKSSSTYGSSSDSNFGTSSNNIARISYGGPTPEPFLPTPSDGYTLPIQSSVNFNNEVYADSHVSYGSSESQNKFGSGQPQTSYGSPQPQTNYGLPQSQISYGSPQSQISYGSLKPEINYGSPKPQSSYGSPKPQINYGSQKPQINYGSPKPQINYGSPKPQINYGSPKPQINYGSPQPQTSYGSPQPQTSYGSSSSNHGLHSNDYGSLQNSFGSLGSIPQNSYGSATNGYHPTVAPHQAYGPPSSSYGAPFAIQDYSQHLPSLPSIDFSWPLALKLNAFTLAKILLKLVIFKMIVKFIAVICLLMFIPKLEIIKKGDKDEANDEDESRELFASDSALERLNILTALVTNSIEKYERETKNYRNSNEECKSFGCRLRKFLTFDQSWNDYVRLFKNYISEETKNEEETNFIKNHVDT